MTMSKIFSAPSNIAIIKYMGKTSPSQNLPTNPSISYTLNHLRSYVSLEIYPGAMDLWQPLEGHGFLPIELSEKGQIKFLNHFKRIKEHWGVTATFIVRSANNFPADCGIASSSSSFAALTLAAVSTCQEINPRSIIPDLAAMSALSRLGSGSSCRSFFEPWALWQGEGAQTWNCEFTNLNHLVLLIDSSKKEVSSSEAHLRVATSPWFSARLTKVKARLDQLERANESGDWNQFCDIAYEEFVEMHELFETSQPSFSYRSLQTRDVLEQLIALNQRLASKILVTMDAGNNIHCMTRKERQADLVQVENLFPKLKILKSWTPMAVPHV